MEIPASSQKAAKAGRKGLIYTEEMIKNASGEITVSAEDLGGK